MTERNLTSIESADSTGTNRANTVSSASFATNAATMDSRHTANGLTQSRSRKRLSKNLTRSAETMKVISISFAPSTMDRTHDFFKLLQAAPKKQRHLSKAMRTRSKSGSTSTVCWAVRKKASRFGRSPELNQASTQHAISHQPRCTSGRQKIIQNGGRRTQNSQGSNGNGSFITQMNLWHEQRCWPRTGPASQHSVHQRRQEQPTLQ
jgi:hypothetical protein